jgi:hypothetical protein
MLLALGAILAVAWILAFLVLHVTTIAIHTLAFGAVLSVAVRFIHVRHRRVVPK